MYNIFVRVDDAIMRLIAFIITYFGPMQQSVCHNYPHPILKQKTRRDIES